jgi:SNF2 family DNA or RNA helicase
MDLRFALTISEHRIFGYVLAPYFIRKEPGKEFHVIFERITELNLARYKPALSPEQIQIVKFIEEYNDTSLHKIFSKKKTTARSFITSLDETMVQDHIRPFIERRISNCLELLRFEDIPVFFKMHQSNLYEDDKVTLVHEDAETIFNFERNDEGITYFLTIQHGDRELELLDKPAVILTNEPCSLIMDEHIFILPDIDSKKLLPFFTRKHIAIPKKTEKKYLESFVTGVIKKYKVKARGFDIVDLDVTPKAFLSLEKDLKGSYILILKYSYDGKNMYYANKRTGVKVLLEENNGHILFKRIRRNYSEENKYITFLLSLGLANIDDSAFDIVSSSEKDGDKGLNLINWVNEHYALLTEKGIGVEQKNTDNPFYLHEFNLEFTVSDKEHDWFDIFAVVEFDGFKIPFKSFRQNILNENRFYELPDGRMVILPGEWFEKYQEILHFTKEDDTEVLRLDRQHFPLLKEVSSGLNRKLKSSISSLLNYDDIVEPPQIHAHLRDYQKTGFNWMYSLYRNNFGGCLADDMGLGKTLQTLALLKKVIHERRNEACGVSEDTSGVQLTIFDQTKDNILGAAKTSLVVVPTSLIHNWLNEIIKFTPDLKVKSYAGTNRAGFREICKDAEIIITTYGIVRNDIDLLAQYEFLYVVLDESQIIRNPGSKTYQAVSRLRSEHRFILTGTPIENSLIDLWAQLNFLNRGLLGNMTFFKNEFLHPIEKHNDDEKKKTLQHLITPFVLRRSKSEVARELPPVSEQYIYCEMNDSQAEIYETEKSKARNLILDNISKFGIEKSSIVILQSLTRLRQIANHPVLTDENYVLGSGKFDEVIRNMESLRQEGHKALVFSSFVKHLDIVGEYLDNGSIAYARLTGETRNREQEIKSFSEDVHRPFFLISLKAGGVGLNLTSADYVLLLDPWWNPASELQAINRAHRIGQDKHVFVYRFITKNTLEEKIIKLQEKKTELADIFINGSNLRNINKEEILSLFD